MSALSALHQPHSLESTRIEEEEGDAEAENNNAGNLNNNSSNKNSKKPSTVRKPSAAANSKNMNNNNNGVNGGFAANGKPGNANDENSAKSTPTPTQVVDNVNEVVERKYTAPLTHSTQQAAQLNELRQKHAEDAQRAPGFVYAPNGNTNTIHQPQNGTQKPHQQHVINSNGHANGTHLEQNGVDKTLEANKKRRSSAWSPGALVANLLLVLLLLIVLVIVCFEVSGRRGIDGCAEKVYRELKDVQKKLT